MTSDRFKFTKKRQKKPKPKARLRPKPNPKLKPKPNTKLTSKPRHKLKHRPKPKLNHKKNNVSLTRERSQVLPSFFNKIVVIF